ncbi:hypothetical protein GJ496_007869 [Pomphorhynchus laevis]|nr:hypothetical protein GJ496_007869 [Pomphorhynchus laevis]
MSDVDRARRKQWLKDQILSPNEPRSVPELQKLLYNPIRRFYRMPMDYLFLKLHPFLGPCTGALRAAIPKIGIGIIVLWSMFYHVKYRRESWERIKGLSVRLIPTRTQHSKIPCIVKPKEHWYDLGFRQRKVFRGDEYKGTYDENPVPLKYWE